MKRLECHLPDSLYEALLERMQTDKTSCDHVVSTALSECLGKPLHTLFQVSTSAALVEGLYQGAVKVVFGIPGAKIDKVFDTLRSSSIRTVVCRHKQNAAFIAGGMGRLTGKAGVAIATSGLGVSDLTTGLGTANSEGDPDGCARWREGARAPS